MKTYVIMLQEGEWDDFHQDPILVCDDKIKAGKLVAQLNEHTKELEEILQNFDHRFYLKYKKENPEPKHILNETMYTFRGDLNFIVAKEKGCDTYKDAYDLYDDYDFKANGRRKDVRKLKKKKPTWEEFYKWEDEVAQRNLDINNYHEKLGKEQEKYRKELMKRFPQKLRKYYLMCSGYSTNFTLEEVDKL